MKDVLVLRDSGTAPITSRTDSLVDVEMQAAVVSPVGIESPPLPIVTDWLESTAVPPFSDKTDVACASPMRKVRHSAQTGVPHRKQELDFWSGFDVLATVAAPAPPPLLRVPPLPLPERCEVGVEDANYSLQMPIGWAKRHKVGDADSPEGMPSALHYQRRPARRPAMKPVALPARGSASPRKDLEATTIVEDAESIVSLIVSPRPHNDAASLRMEDI